LFQKVVLKGGKGMLNKKRLLAMAMTTAMITGALAGCSSDASSNESAAPAETTTQAPAGDDGTETSAAGDDANTGDDANAGDDTTIAPDYTVESGKVIDFEDGNIGFLKQNEANLVADSANVEVADFNGSKALKVSPNRNDSGIVYELGLDVNALLGDQVSKVASVSMQIGVLGSDGNFYPVTGSIKANSTDASSTSWVTYVEDKNPNTATVTLETAYDPESDNVLTITKDAQNGNNGDKGYDNTGVYSTMYVDNIVFFDADGNALDVDTSATFAAESYGDLDWSNLIQVTDQVIISGFNAGATSGWGQAPDWLWNYQTNPVQDTDEDGEPLVDEDGNPVYKQQVDADGNPVVDENGDPVYETETTGSVDWTSIMKPGTVFTLYYNSEMSDDRNHYIWFVLQYPDYGLGWNRLFDAPHAADNDLEAGDPLSLFATNDSNNIAQITYEEIVEFIKEVYGVEDIDWSGNYALQAESGMAWSLSAVTYALDQEY
jgi:hypothetical protein